MLSPLKLLGVASTWLLPCAFECEDEDEEDDDEVEVEDTWTSGSAGVNAPKVKGTVSESFFLSPLDVAWDFALWTSRLALD